METNDSIAISFVIPVFNERDTLAPLVAGIEEHVKPHRHEIVFVDDGSTDGSGEELHRLAGEYPSVRVYRQRGNFGKSAALATGFTHARGDLIFTMDSDLQDDPKEIPRFLEKLDEGFDVVGGWKEKRNDPWHKTVPSYFYNNFVAWLFGLSLHDVNCGFKLFRREVVEKIQVYGEMHRLIPVLAHTLNYRVGEIPVEHHPRTYGVSKFGFERFYRGALDVMTVYFLKRYMYSPNHFFGQAGFIQIVLGILCILATIAAFVVGESEAAVAALAAVGVVFIVSGLGAIGLGLFAELMLRHFIRIDPALYAADEDQ